MSSTTTNKRYIDTRGMSRQQWLAARKQGLGGSDISAIMGLNDYRSPYDVWLDKTGRDDSDDEENTYMRFGRDVEPTIAKWFAEDNGMTVNNDNMMWIHPDYEYLLANIDRTILQGDSNPYPGNGVLECKSTNHWVWRNVDDEVPPAWYLQMQHYTMIKGYSWGAIAALVDRAPEYAFFEADPEIHELILNEAGEFWEQHIIKDEPPKPVVGDDLDKMYSKVKQGKAVAASEKCYNAYKRLQGVKRQIKELEADKEELELIIKSEIGDADAEQATYKGDVIAKWTPISFSKVDGKLIEEKYPDIAEECQKQISYRRLYLK